MLAAVAMATAGKAPMMTTYMMARSVRPNHRMARGSQDIEGSAWSPVIRNTIPHPAGATV